jgi:hypothetical protein
MVWILLLFSEFLLITDSQHVIFESIGQMAGAISYQHAKLTLNLSSIFTQFQRYESALEALKVNLSAPVTLRIRDKDRATFVGEPEITIGSIVRDVRRMNLETIYLDLTPIKPKLHINKWKTHFIKFQTLEIQL